MIYCLTSAVGSIMSLVVIAVGCKPASSKSRILSLRFLCFTFPSCKFKKQRACGGLDAITIASVLLLSFILKVNAVYLQDANTSQQESIIN